MKGLAVLLLALAACGSGAAADRPGACGGTNVVRDDALPAAVAKTEVAILRAAAECDYERLERLADFELGRPDLAALTDLFAGPVVLDGEEYVWPGVAEGGVRTAIDAAGNWRYYGSGDPEVLAGTDDGRIAVLARDGTEERALGTLNPEDASNGFAVTPDGRFAYFDRGGTPACAAEIVRLNLETGRERTVVTGAHPAVSPDGRRLAYVACQQEETNAPDRLVVRRLKSGKEQRIDASGALVGFPSWAPDSRRLAVEVTIGAVEDVRVLDLNDDDPFANAQVVALESTDNTFWFGYRGETGEFYAFTAPGGEAGAGSPLAVIAIDAESGRTLRTLFELDAFCCLIDLAADGAGTAVLAAGTNAGLVVWREGDAAPQPLTPGVRTAAWLSDA